MGEMFNKRRSEFIKPLQLANTRGGTVAVKDFNTMSREDREQFLWEMENVVFKDHDKRVAEMKRRGITRKEASYRRLCNRGRYK